ncbi:MAG: hypothetical protein ACRYG4_00455 [Janthinobacterium lividum]
MIWLAVRAVLLAALSVPVGATLLLLFMRLVPGRWELLRPTAAACAWLAPVVAVLLAVAVLPVLPDPGTGFRALWLAPAWFVVRAIVMLVAVAAFGWVAARGPVTVPVAVAGLVGLTMIGSFAGFDWIQATWHDYHSAQFGLQFVAHLWLGGVAAAVLLTLRRSDGRPDGVAVGVLIASLMLWAYFWGMTYIVNWSADLPEEARWWLTRQHGGWGVALAVLAFGQFAAPFLALLLPAARASRTVVMSICAATLALRVVEMAWLLLPG